MILIGAVALYGGLVAAHYRFDRIPGQREDQTDPRDLSDLFRRLMHEGYPALPQIQEELSRRLTPALAAEVGELLPRPDEPWRRVVLELLESAPATRVTEPRIVEPSGLTVAGPWRILTRGPLPRPAWFELASVDDGPPQSARGEIVMDGWTGLPEAEPLQTDRRYQLSLHEKRGGPLLARGRVETLTAAEERVYRRRMLVLKRFVPDLRSRLYAQAVLAMSGSLFNEASFILFHRLPSAPRTRIEGDLEERSAFLYHRHGILAARDVALRRLRSTKNR